MRKRNHFVGLWLDSREYHQLLKQCSVSGLSASALLRHCIMRIDLRPHPPENYAALLRELSGIGTNVNQIAHWANAQKGVSKADIQATVALLQKTWQLVKATL